MHFIYNVARTIHAPHACLPACLRHPPVSKRSVVANLTLSDVAEIFRASSMTSMERVASTHSLAHSLAYSLAHSPAPSLARSYARCSSKSDHCTRLDALRLFDSMYIISHQHEAFKYGKKKSSSNLTVKNVDH